MATFVNEKFQWFLSLSRLTAHSVSFCFSRILCALPYVRGLNGLKPVRIERTALFDNVSYFPQFTRYANSRPNRNTLLSLHNISIPAKYVWIRFHMHTLHTQTILPVCRSISKVWFAIVCIILSVECCSMRIHKVVKLSSICFARP